MNKKQSEKSDRVRKTTSQSSDNIDEQIAIENENVEKDKFPEMDETKIIEKTFNAMLAGEKNKFTNRAAKAIGELWNKSRLKNRVGKAIGELWDKVHKEEVTESQVNALGKTDELGSSEKVIEGGLEKGEGDSLKPIKGPNPDGILVSAARDISKVFKKILAKLPNKAKAALGIAVVVTIITAAAAPLMVIPVIIMAVVSMGSYAIGSKIVDTMKTLALKSDPTIDRSFNNPDGFPNCLNDMPLNKMEKSAACKLINSKAQNIIKPKISNLKVKFEKITMDGSGNIKVKFSGKTGAISKAKKLIRDDTNLQKQLQEVCDSSLSKLVDTVLPKHIAENQNKMEKQSGYSSESSRFSSESLQKETVGLVSNKMDKESGHSSEASSLSSESSQKETVWLVSNKMDKESGYSSEVSGLSSESSQEEPVPLISLEKQAVLLVLKTGLSDRIAQETIDPKVATNPMSTPSSDNEVQQVSTPAR